MKAYFVVTIDVEPDCTPTWQYSQPLAFKGVSQGIREKLQPLFNKYNATPTYLINNVVLEDQECVSVLAALDGQYELGTHLHPEFINPQKEFDDYAGKRGLANCCHYPPEIEYEKIKSITRLFAECFGYQPTSFRAGRFSAAGSTISSLANLGYKVDTSVTPHVLWDDSTREESVDFRQAREQPYFVKDGSILDTDADGRLLEVPVSILERKANLPAEMLKGVFGLRRPVRRTIPVWLRPVYSSNDNLKSVIDDYLRRYNKEEIVILNMMFHNVEVIPNLSPYCKNEIDSQNYLQQLEFFFKYCAELNIKSIGLSKVYDLYRSN